MKVFRTSRDSFCVNRNFHLFDRSSVLEALVAHKNLKIEILAKMHKNVANSR